MVTTTQIYHIQGLWQIFHNLFHAPSFPLHKTVQSAAPFEFNFQQFHFTDNPSFTGTGFFITDDGYLISNYHVVKDATKVRLLTSAGLIDAKVVQVDAANDIALLKADGKFAPLPIAASRTVALWAARWRRSVFPTSVCRGSRPGK